MNINVVIDLLFSGVSQDIVYYITLVLNRVCSGSQLAATMSL